MDGKSSLLSGRVRLLHTHWIFLSQLCLSLVHCTITHDKKRPVTNEISLCFRMETRSVSYRFSVQSSFKTSCLPTLCGVTAFKYLVLSPTPILYSLPPSTVRTVRVPVYLLIGGDIRPALACGALVPSLVPPVSLST